MAETPDAAMIGGVCTKKEYKRRGYASACLVKMIDFLISENKQPCLFYDNPAAGRIYKRLGFVDIGKWLMAAYN